MQMVPIFPSLYNSEGTALLLQIDSYPFLAVSDTAASNLVYMALETKTNNYVCLIKIGH